MPKSSNPNGLDAVMAEAVRLHQQGELGQAAAKYKKVLRSNGRNADALHLLGVLYHQSGTPGKAIGLIRKAIKLAPNNPAFHSNLGEVQRALGRTDMAAGCYHRALELDPQFIDAIINLGALESERGNADAAAAHFRDALRIDSESVHAQFSLGSALMDLADWPAAAAAFKEVVRLAPAMPDGHIGLGMALKETGELTDAAAALEHALESAPALVSVWNNLGNVYMLQGEINKASACFEKGLTVDPENLTVLANWADLKLAEGDLETARNTYNRILAQDPDNHAAKSGLNNIAFFSGNWSEAWEYHENRFTRSGVTGRPYDFRPWNGEALADKTILVWGEQGIGEEIQFSSIIPDLLAAGARVILESDPRLVPLFQRSWPEVVCIPRSDPPQSIDAEVDFQCASGSLGRFLRRDEAEFPKLPSFLVADAERATEFRRRYRNGGADMLIGVSWVSRTPTHGTLKSMALQEFLPVFRAAEGIRFVDLQYGDTLAERQALWDEAGIELIHDDTIDPLLDLDAFAAQVAALDLVISISNTTVHVAGALGIPTWTLLSTAPLNRWMLIREDSVWYPAIRLFRQTSLGDWPGLIRRVAEELKQFRAGVQKNRELADFASENAWTAK